MTVKSITTDQLALLALKSHITLDPHNTLANNWTTSSSSCNWIGVTCDSRHRRVISLELAYMGIVGTIPSYLGSLSFLRLLNLTGNNFCGHLPTNLMSLRQLKLIDLRYNNFTGSIPQWLGDLSELRFLGLQNNSFSGTVPCFLFNASKLETLNLAFNFIEGNIPYEIGKLGKLQIFRIRGNRLSGSIPLSLFNISTLQLLDASVNSLSGTLPDDTCDHLPELDLFSLSGNELNGNLPSSLDKCNKLQILSLSINKFTGPIPRGIGNLTNLKELYLGSNSFRSEIPNEIGNLLELELLDLTSSNLSGMIPSFLFNMSSLRTLGLQRNNLSGALPIDIYRDNLNVLEWINLDTNQLSGSIPASIGNMTRLKGIGLGNNKLAGIIPQEISYLENLESLSLRENIMSGQIPSSIFNMSKLVTLDLSVNQLSGSFPLNMGIGLPNLGFLSLYSLNLYGVIPDSISNASKLYSLQAQENLLSGSIPTSLCNLIHLQQLDLCSNNLTIESSSTPGEEDFFSCLSNLRNLTSLALGKNPLNSLFPNSLANLSKSLQYLWFDHSSMNGHIPEYIGNLSSLIELDLTGNNVMGKIPISIGRTQLQGFNLGNNSLEGNIPNELCQMKRLFSLSLTNNKLSGSIPSCFANLTNLRYISLGSNNLNSTIPSTFWSLMYILSVNFSSNFLEGSLPGEVGNLKVLTDIDLSNNQLSGHIPSSIGGLQGLLYLSLAQNKLEGLIPKSFGGLLSLETLDLSSNDLYGEIPKSLEKLSHLKYLNVSFNKLRGEIPSEGPFVNFSSQSFWGNEGLCSATRRQFIPLCKVDRTSTKSKEIFLRYILPPILLSMLIIMILFWRFQIRKQENHVEVKKSVLPLTTRSRITHHEIARATNEFSESNLLGSGSFGSVYKAMFSDETIVAVKVFKMKEEDDQGSRSFVIECELLKRIRHRNLIKIITSCSDNLDFKAIVLEYMPNGSLEKWLYLTDHYLNILQKLNIVIDVASALEYLHHGYSDPIVHCDLKPSNVLLDGDMVAHLTDFGIAKLLGEGDSMTRTMTLATIGYMAPEFGLEGTVSTKGDVYSYGILLMETFTVKKPTDEMFVGELSLVQWVKQSFPHAIFHEVVNPKLLIGSENMSTMEECVSMVLELALACCAESPEKRITMKHVSTVLHKIKLKFLSN